VEGWAGCAAGLLLGQRSVLRGGSALGILSSPGFGKDGMVLKTGFITANENISTNGTLHYLKI